MIAGIDEFQEITGYNIELFFRLYNNFLSNDYQNIVNYYNGSDMIARSFAVLDQINEEITNIEPLFILHRSRFNTIDFWTILDLFSDIFVAIETVNNLDKWSRSSRTTQFDAEVRVTRVLRQGETFELVSRNLGSTNYDNEWARTAIENYIIEEDYTPNGGTMFSVVLRNNLNFSLPNIVDNLQGDNVYGKDILIGFEFENNDLKTVVGMATLRQILGITLQTRKGSIPEFPEDGIEDAVIGSNVNSIQYPTIFRNLLNVFRKDGRWSEVNLLDLFRDQDSVFMRLEVKSILKDSIITNINI